MPELPEVETIKRGLSAKIRGLKITSVDPLFKPSLQGDSAKLVGQKVINVWRRGKIVGIDLEENTTLLIHLKMSGQLILVNGDSRFIGGHPTEDMQMQMPNKSSRVMFTFNDNSQLFFNDQRKFGWIKVIPTDKLQEIERENLFGKLGPEPLEKEFTWQVLKQQLLKRKNTSIKVALMDQEVIAGVGNIYASECCFNAKINPERKVSELYDDELQRLHDGLMKALQDGIRYGGSSRTHFVNAEGERGLFLDYANVYSREDKPCKVCGTMIKRITQSGRSTFYCPHCQAIGV